MLKGVKKGRAKINTSSLAGKEESKSINTIGRREKNSKINILIKKCSKQMLKGEKREGLRILGGRMDLFSRQKGGEHSLRPLTQTKLGGSRNKA